jgi:hypothetical protein
MTADNRVLTFDEWGRPVFGHTAFLRAQVLKQKPGETLCWFDGVEVAEWHTHPEILYSGSEGTLAWISGDAEVIRTKP